MLRWTRNWTTKPAAMITTGMAAVGIARLLGLLSAFLGDQPSPYGRNQPAWFADSLSSAQSAAATPSRNELIAAACASTACRRNSQTGTKRTGYLVNAGSSPILTG